MSERRILLTGATGYVGGRLLHRLESRGYPIRCLARHPEHLSGRVGRGTEVVRGDVLEADTLGPALEGVETAYYMVHSMGSNGIFEELDKRAARNFGAAARAAGVRRIIYLGGLGEEGQSLSSHLRSRHEVGRVLRESGVPVIEFRASIVIGSGSLSFEMIRALVEALPVIVAPRWVEVPAQPISIDDLLTYLEKAFEVPLNDSRVYEIGGADRMSYGDLMREYARQRGLRRVMIRVPVLTPRLSSLWLVLVTPLYARVGRKLIDSICHPTVVHDTTALRTFGVKPMTVSEAIARAVRNEDREFAETRWSDAVSVVGSRKERFGGARVGNRLVDSRDVWVGTPPREVLRRIRRIGGRTGWYGCERLWRIRGAIDLLIGGVGMRRGRPHPDRLQVGDPVDFWRVERFEPEGRLLLRAEMKVPGRAWLQFEVTPERGGSRVYQTATFDPAGLAGSLYWYALYPIHVLVFGRMLAGVAGTMKS